MSKEGECFGNPLPFLSGTVFNHEVALILVICFWCYVVQNSGNFLHGGATATLVDMVGSAVIYTVGAPVTGVSVEINISYLDAAFADVSDYPTICYVKSLSLSCL